MNPFDALLAPPALVKRAFEDLHELAQLARRYNEMEETLVARVERLAADLGAMRAGIERLEVELAGTRGAVEPLSAQIGHMEQQLADLAEELEPIQHLAPIRRGIEPLEQSMVAVRESVDELEPMITDLDGRIRRIEPQLDEMHESIEPIGDLAEKIPGNRGRRND